MPAHQNDPLRPPTAEKRLALKQVSRSQAAPAAQVARAKDCSRLPMAQAFRRLRAPVVGRAGMPSRIKHRALDGRHATTPEEIVSGPEETTESSMPRGTTSNANTLTGGANWRPGVFSGEQPRRGCRRKHPWVLSWLLVWSLPYFLISAMRRHQPRRRSITTSKLQGRVP
jgi:hypothetical protein